MSTIPAICQNTKCGIVFFTNAFAVAEGITTDIFECRIGPCPSCGDTGKIPSGKYSQIGAATLFSPLTAKDGRVLAKALRLVRQAVANGMTTESFQRQAKHQAPELSALWKLVPKDQTSAYAFWGLVILVIQLILQLRGTPESAPAELILPPDVIDAIHQMRPDSRSNSHKKSPQRQPREF